MGVDFRFEGEGSEGDGYSINEEQEDETEEWDDENLQEKLYDFAIEHGDDLKDEDLLKIWIVLGVGKISLPGNTQANLCRC